MHKKTLNQIVEEQPFYDYTDWWNMGQAFLGFMSEAIVSQWSGLYKSGDLGIVKNYVSEYLNIVYGRQARALLVEDFVDKAFHHPLQSGEFDALSYSFFRSAFELIESHIEEYDNSLEIETRLFTKRVGKIFFEQLHHHLNLDLPDNLNDEQSFIRLKDCIQQTGVFLKSQGYLRDHFGFTFTVDVEHAGRRIVQAESEFLENLKQKGIAYALYEMSYAVILPSAVYLYHTIGEAQHHSSRTIEELFELVGYEARETDDFDPLDHPSDRVIELWEIRKLKTSEVYHT
jgi:hypothetical protein